MCLKNSLERFLVFAAIGDSSGQNRLEGSRCAALSEKHRTKCSGGLLGSVVGFSFLSTKSTRNAIRTWEILTRNSLGCKIYQEIKNGVGVFRFWVNLLKFHLRY